MSVFGPKYRPPLQAATSHAEKFCEVVADLELRYGSGADEGCRYLLRWLQLRRGDDAVMPATQPKLVWSVPMTLHAQVSTCSVAPATWRVTWSTQLSASLEVRVGSAIGVGRRLLVARGVVLHGVAIARRTVGVSEGHDARGVERRRQVRAVTCQHHTTPHRGAMVRGPGRSARPPPMGPWSFHMKNELPLHRYCW